MTSKSAISFAKWDIAQLDTVIIAISKEVEIGAQGAKERLKSLKDSMSNTANAAVQAANGGVVALDKLNKGFNWAALGATALNAAINFGISVLLSAVVSLISDYIHRVERAHQATAVYKNQL